MIRWGVTRLLQGLVLVGLVGLIAGQLLGQPILLGFVETGSMEPTIETGDGFVAIPAEISGDPEPGDVVVFEAEVIEGGGLTTHRIVDETDRGYVTQGDANPFTDQDSDEPPVQEGQIVATVWQPTDDVVTIPALGTAIMTIESGLDGVGAWLATTFGMGVFLETSGVAIVILVISIVLYAVETIRERRSPSFESTRGEDDSIDPRSLAVGFALLMVVTASAAMLVPGGTQSYDVVSAEFESDRPLVIEQGTTDDVSYPIENGGLVPIVSYVDSESDVTTVESERVAVGPREEDELTVSITAPEETGHYPVYITEYRYLHVLPLPVIDALYEIHPWVPFLTIVTLFGGGSYAVGRLVLGSSDRRSKRTVARTNCTSGRGWLRRLF